MRALPGDRDPVVGRRDKVLLELSEPIRVGRKRSPFVLVSCIERRPETPWVGECMAFLAEEDGHVLDWDEIEVAYISWADGVGFGEVLQSMIGILEGGRDCQGRSGDASATGGERVIPRGLAELLEDVIYRSSL